MAWFALPASAQTVLGPWVDQAEQRIEATRKADVRVLVLDERQRPVPDVAVRFEQARHAFPLGVVVHAGGLAGYDPDAAVWRCFNAASLRPLTAWPGVQPSGPTDFDFEAIDAALTWAELFGLDVHFGGMLSADPAFQPGWAVGLEGDEKLDAARRYIDAVVGRFRGRLRSAALYVDDLEHDWLTDAELRWLFRRAALADPAASFWVGEGHAMEGERGRRALIEAERARQVFIPSAGLSVGQVFGAEFRPGVFRRWTQRIGGLDLPVLVDGLEVGGASDLNAPANLETVLITLFAEPTVAGIYLDGVLPSTARDPAAALIDEHGQPTGSGAVLDRLFRQRWWTDEAFTSDVLGYADARVFKGRHRVTATLPNGRRLEAQVEVTGGAEQGVLVLEPVWSE